MNSPNSHFCFCSQVHEKSLLIMENLFYKCDISNKFDLKGSVRNRLVDQSNQSGEEIVWMDENLIQSKYIWHSINFLSPIIFISFLSIPISVVVKAAVHFITYQNDIARGHQPWCIFSWEKRCDGLFTTCRTGQCRKIASARHYRFESFSNSYLLSFFIQFEMPLFFFISIRLHPNIYNW